jgi:hypothetical protein
MVARHPILGTKRPLWQRQLSAENAKDVEQARSYYAEDFADYRRKRPMPCMEGLRFQRGGRTTPAIRILSDADLETVVKEGQE